MKAAVYHGPRDVRLEEIDVPKIGLHDVLVKVDVALTCGTDRKMLLRGHHMFKPPFVFGHEFAGTIAEVGSAVKGFRPGMRVVAANSAPCNTCFFCRRGQQNMCEDLYIRLSGAFAEYIDVPAPLVEQNLLVIPEDVPSRDAALVEPLACVVHGFEWAGVHPGDTVVVNGAGPIGLMFVRLAAMKPARVVVTDILDERLERAKRLGAETAVNVKGHRDAVRAVRELCNDGRGADVAIEAVGLPETWDQTIRMVRKGGVANLFGGCAEGTKITVDAGRIHYEGVQIRGTFHHMPTDVRQAMDLIARAVVTSEEFVTKELPLAQLDEILDGLVRGVGIKTAVVP